MIDPANWTGRHPRTSYPKFEFVFATPWLYLTIGALLWCDAYGIELAWGRVRDPKPGISIYRHNRHWLWVKREELRSARYV